MKGFTASQTVNTGDSSNNKQVEPTSATGTTTDPSAMGAVVVASNGAINNQNQSPVILQANTLVNLNSNEAKLDPSQQIRPTWKRYIILFLFCLMSGNKAFQWMQIPSSTTKATLLYDVDHYVINFTSVIFMLSFIVLSWPACFIIDQIGLRKAVLLSAFGTAIGAVIKLYSCHEEGIVLLLVGQVLVSLSEQLIFSVPSRLASVWFPDNQVTSAVSMCILGNQFGMALGFLVPQWYLEEATTKEEIGEGFYQMFLLTAGISVFAYVIDYFLFDEEPKYAPGAARLKQRTIEREEGPSKSMSAELGSLFSQIGALVRTRKLILLSLSYGINIGLSYTISTLLNQQIEPIWPDDDLIVGETGFLIIVVGALGLPLWGALFDKFHKYKLINILLVIGTILSLILYSVFIDYMRSPYGIYVTAALIGLFQTGFMAGGLELAIELTYPAPELVTSSVMNVMPQVFGTVFVFVGSYIVDTYGSFATNVFYLVGLLFSLLLLFCSHETLKRQSAIHSDDKRKALDNGIA